jgi:hypothetical protein
VLKDTSVRPQSLSIKKFLHRWWGIVLQSQPHFRKRCGIFIHSISNMKNLIFSFVYFLLAMAFGGPLAAQYKIEPQPDGSVIVQYQDAGKIVSEAPKSFPSKSDFAFFLLSKQRAIIAVNEAMIEQLKVNEQRLKHIDDVTKSMGTQKPRDDLKPDKKPP